MKDKVNYVHKERSSRPTTTEHSQTAPFLIHQLKEMSHSSARLVLARSLKDGIKDSLNSKKDKKPHLFAHLIMLMVQMGTHLLSHQMLLSSLKSSFWISWLNEPYW